MRLFLLLASLAFTMRADTITLKNDIFINGIVTFDHGNFIVAGRVQGKAVSPWTIPAINVKAVRFNALDDNPNPPQDIIRPRGLLVIKCEAVIADQTSTVAGTLRSIDGDNVVIDSANGPLPRERVTLLRIK